MRQKRESTEPQGQDSGTIVVFGGVTLEGFENARKLADHFTSLGRGVIWFDGFPGDKAAYPPHARLVVVDYGERERDRRLNRLERKRTEKIADITEDPAASGMGYRTAASGHPGASANLAENADRFLARLLKRWNTATRGYSSWRLIRGEVLALSTRLTPAEILYCDDHALTAAWHAARLWPATPVTRARS